MEIATAIDEGIGHPSDDLWIDAGLVATGLIGLIFGANWLVTSAESLARAFGVSELIIGLTLVAIGTSLPELATTVVAVRRREADLAVGNVVGSNLFNMLLIGGLSALIHPLTVQPRVLVMDFPMMVGITVAAFLMTLAPPFRLERWQGAVLLAAYLGLYGLAICRQLADDRAQRGGDGVDVLRRRATAAADQLCARLMP